MCDCAVLKHRFEDINVLMLELNRDYFLRDRLRIKTRIEAFIEQIEANREFITL